MGKREREARKSRRTMGKSRYAMQDRNGMVTLLLGRKKFSEAILSNHDSLLLKKKFIGCVVETER